MNLNRKTSHLRAFCAGLLVATLPFAASAKADDGQMQMLPASPAYTMPVGEHSTRTVASAEASPLLMPGGDAAYRKMKDGIAAAAARQADASSARGLSVEARAGDRAVIAPTCATNAASGFFPSDIHGAVGTTNMVVVTNVNMGVFNRVNCALVASQTLKAFFAPTGVTSTSTLFDPRVIRDPLTGRFFLTAESREPSSSGNTNQFQYFAVSTNSLGTAWFKYRITLSVGTSFFCKKAANSFWDYPNNGSSNLRWFITANDFGTTDTSAALTINKAPTLSGLGTSVRCYKALTPFLNLAPPIVRDNSTTATFLSTGSGSGTVITRRDYVMSNVNHANDVMFSRPSYDITNWTGPADARQPNLQELDSLDGRFQSASIQSLGQLWNTHSIQFGTVPAVKVYRLGNTSTTSSPVLNQVVAPCTQSPCDDQINPSVGTRGEAGNAVFVGFTRTNRNFATTGRAAMVVFRATNNTLAGFTHNTITTSATQFVQECTSAGCTSCNAAAKGACRWGDYSSTQLDPSSNAVGFHWNQIVVGTNSSNWATRGGRRN